MGKTRSKDQNSIRWSIKWRIIAIMTILMVSLVAVLSYIQISSQKSALEVELNNRIVLMKENLAERGRSYIGSLTRQVENDIAAYNFSGAVEVIKASVRENEDIKFAILMDSSAVVYVHTLKPELVQTQLAGDRDLEALKKERTSAVTYNEGDEPVMEIVNPVQVGTENWGALRLIYTLQSLHDEIEASRREIQQDINGMIYGSVLTSAGFLVAGFVIVLMMASRFLKPLMTLTESARRLSRGDFSASSGVNVPTMDEVGLLAETFTQMSKDLEVSYKKLEDYSKTLEEKVEDRTREVKRALRDTAEARDWIDGILKSVADGLIVTDLENRVVLMNSAAEDLLGVTLGNTINRPIDFAIAEKTLRGKIMETLDKKSTGTFFDFQLPGDDPKHPRIMRARTSVVHDSRGAETGIVTIIHDVTHEREVDRMKTEFISTAAHELRSPLTSIQGFSDILMIREDLSEKEKKKFLSYISKQSEALTNIINDLLDISRIESGRGYTLQKILYDTSGSVQKVISYFQEQYRANRFDAVLLEKPLALYADREKMEQVVKNLLNNAVKYSPEGGAILVTEGVSPGRYHVTVKDQGVGMSPEEVGKIFDKFYRADASDRGIEGTGLGMTIVKHIVEAHGGEVSVESEPGRGTAVTVSIPMEGG